MNDKEHKEQSALISWCRLFENRYPALKLIFATPNARKCTPRQGAYLNAEGRKKGVWDLFLSYPYGTLYYGLYIEMKSGKNKLTPEQIEWEKLVTAVGYKCVVARSWQEAANEICEYLGINEKV